MLLETNCMLQVSYLESYFNIWEYCLLLPVGKHGNHVSVTNSALTNNNIRSHQSLKSTCLKNEKRLFIRAILKNGKQS